MRSSEDYGSFALLAVNGPVAESERITEFVSSERWSSTRPNLNVTGVYYYYDNDTIYKELPMDIVRYRHLEGTKGHFVDIDFRGIYLSSFQYDYVYIEVDHAEPLSANFWSHLYLIHPESNTNLTSRDLFNEYAFTPGHFVEIRYSPVSFSTVYRPGTNATTLDRFSSFLGFKGPVKDFSYQSTIQHIPYPTGYYNNRTSVIVLRPQSSVEILEHEEEKTSFKDTMSKIGGLMGLVGSILVFLFGASLLSPWGFLASIPFFRRRMSNSLAKAYDSSEGLSKGPFTTRIDEIGGFEPSAPTTEMRVVMLKERIDELELVLSEFYLNGSVFSDYAAERNKVKLERTMERPKGFQDFGGAGGERLPSQNLYENQHAPSNPRTGLDQYHHQQSSEPSAFAYYQHQQTEKQREQERKKLGQQRYQSSDQSLIPTMYEEDGATSPPFSEHEAQIQGLLHLDHNNTHQPYTQREEFMQSPPAGPPLYPSRSSDRGSVSMMAQGEYNFIGHSAAPSTAAMPLNNNATPASTTRHPSVTAVQSTFASTGTSGASGTGMMPGGAFEHFDLTDMSKTAKE
ncbi:hypothetical protein BGX28_003801 [Mortierella sp. GBA30]|nr:hypothetical protein BGX28_003801 [Mortierella sp. GBA30]